MSADAAGFIGQLEADLEAARARSQELTQALERVKERLNNLEAAILALRRLNYVSAAPIVGSDPGVEDDADEFAFDEGYSDLAPLRDADGEASTGGTRKRIRSTQMVVDLMDELRVPLTKAGIREEFERKFGFPPAWKNPDNALNNAIARAAADGKIRQIGEQDMYVSKLGTAEGVNPFAAFTRPGEATS